ncbi:putative signal peptide protein [Puccinia sorghi]|uniref:Putative signal peptide protein n=1 Tax=Puccinia sorghi TaxID=27349 RepID=A0A0L6UNS3_9BASI|nr:putative signal peptide protein [Puccinia sorghi]
MINFHLFLPYLIPSSSLITSFSCNECLLRRGECVIDILGHVFVFHLKSKGWLSRIWGADEEREHQLLQRRGGEKAIWVIGMVVRDKILIHTMSSFSCHCVHENFLFLPKNLGRNLPLATCARGVHSLKDPALRQMEDDSSFCNLHTQTRTLTRTPESSSPRTSLDKTIPAQVHTMYFMQQWKQKDFLWADENFERPACAQDSDLPSPQGDYILDGGGSCTMSCSAEKANYSIIFLTWNNVFKILVSPNIRKINVGQHLSLDIILCSHLQNLPTTLHMADRPNHNNPNPFDQSGETKGLQRNHKATPQKDNKTDNGSKMALGEIESSAIPAVAPSPIPKGGFCPPGYYFLYLNYFLYNKYCTDSVGNCHYRVSKALVLNHLRFDNQRLLVMDVARSKDPRKQGGTLWCFNQATPAGFDCFFNDIQRSLMDAIVWIHIAMPHPGDLSSVSVSLSKCSLYLPMTHYFLLMLPNRVHGEQSGPKSNMSHSTYQSNNAISNNQTTDRTAFIGSSTKELMEVWKGSQNPWHQVHHIAPFYLASHVTLSFPYSCPHPHSMADFNHIKSNAKSPSLNL